MAKQTFTTGQVLTAAQMTDLQQTAMGGGSPVTKTASYVLVAADAGTVIQMNSASSTTITVNTALFAAGDSIQIQNIGSGTCTITAGTATVTTAGSLALTQWEGGSLYFTSTSAAIFFDIVQSSAGGGMTLISTTTLTGTTVTLSSIPQTYNNLRVVIQNFKPATDNKGMTVRLNGDATASRHANKNGVVDGTNQTFNATLIDLGRRNSNSVATDLIVFDIPDYANTVTWKCIYGNSFMVNATTTTNYEFQTINGFYNQTTAISSLEFGVETSGTFTSGTLLLYGVK